MAKPKVYVETSVISYLTSRPSRDIVVAGHPQVTKVWWEQRRKDFHLVASELVIEEAAAGDAAAARQRTEALEELKLLGLSESALELAHDLVQGGPLPEKAAEDALHIAIAVVNGVEYLLTWNPKHLAKAARRASIGRICRRNGYEPSILCTPEELLEGVTPCGKTRSSKRSGRFARSTRPGSVTTSTESSESSRSRSMRAAASM